MPRADDCSAADKRKNKNQRGFFLGGGGLCICVCKNCQTLSNHKHQVVIFIRLQDEGTTYGLVLCDFVK